MVLRGGACPATAQGLAAGAGLGGGGAAVGEDDGGAAVVAGAAVVGGVVVATVVAVVVVVAVVAVDVLALERPPPQALSREAVATNPTTARRYPNELERISASDILAMDRTLSRWAWGRSSARGRRGPRPPHALRRRGGRSPAPPPCRRASGPGLRACRSRGRPGRTRRSARPGPPRRGPPCRRARTTWSPSGRHRPGSPVGARAGPRRP